MKKIFIPMLSLALLSMACNDEDEGGGKEFPVH